MKIRQELTSLEEKTHKKSLYIDTKKLSELMLTVDTADIYLTNGDFESSYKSLMTAESNLRAFSKSLIEEENRIRIFLDGCIPNFL